METIIRPASIKDHELIAAIGRVAVEKAHRDSCSVEDMNQFLLEFYNPTAIKAELADVDNCYNIIYNGTKPAGFSKIVLNAAHQGIPAKNVTKLDRIYLLEEYYNLKLGYELLQFNINLSRNNNQSGMWLFTWTGNERAVRFYTKAGFTIIGSHRFKISETHYNPNHHMFLAY